MDREDFNFFSKRGKKLMYKFRNLRDVFFLPISKTLMKIGVTANMVSYIGLFFLIGFIYYVNLNPVLASIFLLVHVLIDAFDGPLARLVKQNGDSGAFTDILCDHTGMAVVIITLIWAKLANPIIASIYIYIYTILIIFVIVRNKMNIPIGLVMRTKYYAYILYGIYAFWNFNYLNFGLIIFNILMIPSVFTSYFVIKRKLNEIKN